MLPGGDTLSPGAVLQHRLTTLRRAAPWLLFPDGPAFAPCDDLCASLPCVPLWCSLYVSLSVQPLLSMSSSVNVKELQLQKGLVKVKLQGEPKKTWSFWLPPKRIEGWWLSSPLNLPPNIFEDWRTKNQDAEQQLANARALQMMTEVAASKAEVQVKNCICAVMGVPHSDTAQVKCSVCKSSMHSLCMSIPTNGPNQTSYVCVVCRAMWLDPFAPVVTCVDGSSDFAQQQYVIPAASQNGTPNVINVDFNIVKAVHDDIMGGSRSLEVRCFMGNPPYNLLNHRWPLDSRVNMNNITCSLQQAAQAWDGHAYKDRNEDKPLVVPRNLLRVGSNRITITSFDPQGHILFLAVTETLTPNLVVEQVKSDKMMPYLVAHRHMKKSFGEWDENDDLVPGPAVLPLTCPLTMTRLTTPARGQKCRHLECFDLNAYIELARTTTHPRWTCPRCNGPARPHQLQVDSWVMDVLEKSPSDRLEVEVQPDGQFGAVPERPQLGSGNSTRKRKAAAAATLELDDDDEL